jgi:hypothetical protein
MVTHVDPPAPNRLIASSSWLQADVSYPHRPNCGYGAIGQANLDGSGVNVRFRATPSTAWVALPRNAEHGLASAARAPDQVQVVMARFGRGCEPVHACMAD